MVLLNAPNGDSSKWSAKDTRLLRWILFRLTLRSNLESVLFGVYALPLVTLQVIVAIRHFSSSTIVLLFGSLVSNWLLIVAAQVDSEAHTLLSLQRGFLDRFTECTFAEHDLKELFGAERYASLSRDRRFSSIRLFSIACPPGSKVPSQYLAYQLLGKTYIFTRDIPTRLSGTAKFFLLHEIAHGDHFSLFAHTRWLNGFYTMAGLIFWLLLTMTFRPLSILSTCFVLLASLWVRRRWDLGPEIPDFHSEVQADGLALDMLSVEEKGSLERFLKRRPMPSDPRLLERHNLRRDELLREGLHFSQEGHLVGGTLHGMDKPSLIVSGTFSVLLFVAAILWPQAESLARAIFAALFMSCVGVVIVLWAVGIQRYREYQTTTEINRRVVVEKAYESSRVAGDAV